MPINLDDLYKNNKGDSQSYKAFSGDIDTPSAINPINPVFQTQRNLTQNFDPSSLQGDYDQILYSGLDNDEIRAQTQSGGAQLGGALYNTGLELVLGTVSNVGRALDFQSHAAMLSGAQDDANNFFSEYIDTLKDDIDYDIYRTHWSQGFNPLSTGWWADMMPQLASSISMAIPATALVKGLSMIGVTGRLGKGIAAMRRMPGMATAIGEAGGVKNLSQGIIGGLASRSIESLAEASQTYKGTYDEVMNAIGDENIARQAASDAAHSTYKNNWLLAATDVLQYTQIMNGFSKKGELLKALASEAGEEGAQFIFDKEANYDALSSVNLVEYSTFGDRLSGYLKDSEFYNSLAGGALGGGVFHAVGEYIENKNELAPETPKVKEEPEEKLKKIAESITQQNTAAIAGDKKKFFDIADDGFATGLLESLQNNTTHLFKKQFEDNKTTPKEQLDLVGTTYEQMIATSNRRIKDIEDAEQDWKSLAKLSPEARKMGVAALADNRSKTARLSELTSKFENETGGNFLANQIQPEYQAAKISWYNLQAVKNPTLQGYVPFFQKQLEDNLKAAGITEKDLPVTAADNRFITMRRDMLSLHTDVEQSKPYVKDYIDAASGDEKALGRLEERAHKAIDDKFIKNITNESDASLQAVAQSATRNRVKEAAQAELDRRQEELNKAELEAEQERLNQLASQGQQPNDVESKKADIETIRQEELNQLEKELNDLGIVVGKNNLEETAKKLLEDIQSPFIKQILKGLINLISKTGTKLNITKGDVSGMGVSYDHVTNTIQINLDTIIDGFNRNSKLRASGGRDGFILQTFDAGKGKVTAISYLASQLLHETIHAFTTRQINNFEKNSKNELTQEEYDIIQNIQNIFNYIKSNKILQAEYGISDIHELLAELFSNETFADKLKNINLPKELQYKAKSKNLFEGIIDLISDLITKAVKGFSKQIISNEETAFENISNLVNDLINARYDAELAALEDPTQTFTQPGMLTPQELLSLASSLKTGLNAQDTQSSQDGLVVNLFSDNGITPDKFKKFNSKAESLIQYPVAVEFSWLQNEDEMLEGTEIYFQVPTNPSSYHSDSVEKSEIGIYRLSDNKLVGFVAHNRSIDLRTKVYNAWKTNNPVRYVSTIEHKSRGDYNRTQKIDDKHVMYSAGEIMKGPFTLGFGRDNGDVYVPNSKTTVEKAIVSKGEVVLVVNGTNGIPVTAKVVQRPLLQNEIDFIVNLLPSATEVNYKDISDIINEITYVGDQSTLKHLEIKFFNDSVMLAGNQYYYDDIADMTSAQEAIKLILSNPDKRRNVIEARTNDTTTKYRDITNKNKVYDNYNDFLEDTKVITGSYIPGRVFTNPMLFFNPDKVKEETLPSNDSTTVVNTPPVAAQTRFTRNIPRYQLKKESDVIKDSNEDIDWLKKTYPNVPVNVVKDVAKILNDGGEAAWGAFYNGAVFLAQNRPEGVAYHEAFHVVFDMLLNDKQRDTIYKEVASKYNITDKGKAEEFLAEKFKSYMVVRESKVPNSILDFFKRLYNIIMDFIVPNNITIDSLLYRASNGILSKNPKRVRISKDYIASTAKRMTIPGFTPAQEREALDIIVYELFSLMDNTIDEVLTKLNPDKTEPYNYTDVLRYFGDPVADAKRKANPKEKVNVAIEGINELYDEVFDRLRELANDVPRVKMIVDNENLKPELRNLGLYSLREKSIKELHKYGLPISLKNKIVANDEVENNINENEVTQKENWQTKYGEKAIEEDKLNPRVKRIIRSLPRITKWNGGIENAEYEIGYFGLPRMVDFTETWLVLKRGLAQADSADEMIQIIRELAATTKHKEFYYLANIIEAGDYSSRSQFFTSLSNAKNEYVSVIYKPIVEKSDFAEEDFGPKKYTMSVINANRRTADKVYISEWRNNMMNAAANVDKKLIASEGKFKNSFKEISQNAFNALPKEGVSVANAAIAFTTYFNRIGIGVQVDTINKFFSENPKTISNYFSGSHSSIKAVNDSIQNNEDPFSTQGSLFRLLSKLHVNDNPRASTDNIKRAGKTIHTYANKSFLNKWFESYTKNENFIKPYRKVSYWANLLDANPTKYAQDFNFQILSESRVQEVGKNSKEYKDFNPADSLLASMALFDNNNGTKAFFNILTPADNPVMRTVSFTKLANPDAYNGLKQHFVYEVVRMKDAMIFLNKVKAAKEAYEKAEEGTTDKDILEQQYKTLYNELVLNYHYQPKTDKLSENGNAFKLQNFKSPILQKLATKYAKAAAEGNINVPFTKSDLAIVGQEINNIVEQEIKFQTDLLLKYKGLTMDENGKLVSPYLSVPDINNFMYAYMYNKLLANMEMTNLFMGGAEFYKKDGGSDYAIIDPAKRATQLSAPGEDQNPKGGRNGDKFRMIVIQTEKLTSRHDGKSKIDYTDASSFITWTRFSDIIRGTGRYTKEYIKHSKALKDGDMTKTGEVQVQPIKGHYFGHLTSPVNNLIVPMQVKSASTTLLKSLTKTNPKLKTLRAYMEKHGIDEAVYDSAIKTGLRQVVTWEQIEADMKGEKVDAPYVYTMEKRNWKWQQNVPEHHISHDILMGTQLRKLIMAGVDINNTDIVYDVNGQMLSGKQIYDLYNELTSRNVIEDLDKLVDDVSDDIKLFNRFKEEIENNNMGQNYELAIKLQNGRVIIPPTMSKALEFVYNSFFNKVIKQKVKGGQFVQVAALGNEQLQFVKNEDGVITEAEVLLPWWVKEFFPFKLNDKGVYELEGGKVSEALLHALGYRIPTESKYSMIQFKVVGFLPPESGSCIICPPEVVDQMGSDFDVDKLFVMFYSWRKETKEVDSPDGVFIRNNPDGSITRYNKVTEYVKDTYDDIATSTKPQRNNRLLDIMRSVLNNPVHFNELTGKNNFDDLERIANEISPLTDSNPYVYPSSQEIARINNMEGGNLIGLGANINIFHAVAQFSNLNLGKSVKNAIVFRNSDDTKTYPILVGEESLNISKKYDVRGIEIAKALSQFLAAFVDNAKNPLAARLNINFLTFPVISAIILTGNTLDTALYFVNQPVIKELSERWKAAGSKPGSVGRIINELYSLMPDAEFQATLIGTKDLKSNIGKELSSPYQKLILNEFSRIQNIASDIDKTVQRLRVDSSGVSPNISDNIDKLESIGVGINQAKIANIKEFFEDYPQADGTMNVTYPMIRTFTSVLQKSAEMSQKYFPWGRDEFKEIHTLISKNNRATEYLSADDKFNIDLSFLQYLHENYMPYFTQVFNKKKLNVFNGLGNLIEGIKVLHEQSLEKSENLTTFVKNPFISYLNKTEAGHLEFAPDVEFTKEEKEEIIDAFRELYKMDIAIPIGNNATITSKVLLNNVIMYSFMKNGFKKSRGSFMEFIPVDITDSLNFREFYRQYLDYEITVNPEDFAKKYLKNAESMARVPYVMDDLIVATAMSGKTMVKFQIDMEKSLQSLTYYPSENALTIKAPLIVSNKGLYYELVDYDTMRGYYQLTNKLGSLNSFEEYTQESIIPSNNIPNTIDMNVQYPAQQPKVKTYVEPSPLLIGGSKPLELPVSNTREYTPENITSLKPNEVFVFGANTAGGHGGGTAGLAQRGTTSSNYTALPIGTKGKWAEYGVVDKLMQGTEGKSFGIVTKAASISGTSLKIGAKRSVPLSRIEESINALIKTATENPNLKFLVTKFGTNMAGFSEQEMKSLLENKTLPDNIILPKEFEVRDNVVKQPEVLNPEALKLFEEWYKSKESNPNKSRDWNIEYYKNCILKNNG